jgi:hypothetical protein
MKLIRVNKICLNETYSEVRICKNLFHEFPIQKSLKQEDETSPLVFNLALEYVIRKVQEKTDKDWN